MKQNSKNEHPGPFLPSIKIQKCPVESSLGILGRKWTLLILRNIGVFKIKRFNQMLSVTPGLTPRVLSMRLNELEKTGFIRYTKDPKSPKTIQWTLTRKGIDTLPILMSFAVFGSKWNADQVFEDKKPRVLKELFSQSTINEYMK